MHIARDDLFCPECRSYVHLFLEQCPACGRARTSRFGDVAAGLEAGIEPLADDDGVRQALRELVLRYTVVTTRMTTFGSGDRADERLTVDGLRDVVRDVARAIPYRTHRSGPGHAAPVDGRLGIVDGELRLQDPSRRTTLLGVRPDRIVAATPAARRGAPARWAGIAFERFGALPAPLVPAGDLLLTFATGDGTFGQLSVANRPGLLAAKARADHFATLGEWLGLLAAVEAERRWREVGLGAYAVEIGLRSRTAPTGGVAATGAPGTPMPWAAESPPIAPGPAGELSVRAALEQLEELRAAGLVTAAEFDEKRREILARL